jgi:hypothetical protein
MTCVRRTAVVTRVERTSPYRSAREADEALDCFPHSSPHRFRARVTQVQRTATLAPLSVTIDECWPQITPLVTSRLPSGQPCISYAHFGASVHAMVWSGRVIRTVHTSRH